MSELITAGSTDQTIDIFLQDSSSGTGAGLTGLAFNSSGLKCYYRKGATGSATQLTLATQTVGGSHTDGGFVEIDSTNAPGLYRLDLSDTMVAAEGFVSVYLHGATNLLQTALRINCQTLAADVVKVSGDSTAADNLELDYDGTGYNKSNSTIGTTTTNTDMRGTDSAFLASSAPSNFSSLGISASGHISQVTLVDTTTTNTDMVDVSSLATASSIAALNNFDPATQTVTTDSASRTASQADVSALATASALNTVDTVVDGIKSVTDNLPNSGALTDLATAAALTTVDSVVDGIKVTTDKLDDTFELDGSDYRFTANALEEAPTGGGGSAPTEAEIYTYFTASSREDVFKADVSGLATQSSVNTIDSNVDAVLVDTGTTLPATLSTIEGKVDTVDSVVDAILVDTNELQSDDVPGLIAALNDLSSADVTAAVPTAASIADAVLDEALSGHNVAGSVGKALRQLKEGVISVESSVNDSSATTTTFVSNLTETTDGFYHDKVIVFISGDLAGQARHIETYTGSTKSITVSTAFTSAPSNADEFLILATHEHSISEIQAGLATSASIAALNDLSSADVTAAVPTAAQIRTEIDSNSTQLALLVDGQGYQLTVLAGAISNAGATTEAYTFTYNSTDYAATYAGLDASGNRGTTVLSKS